MPRLAFKPDSSFFRKIVIGAVGTRTVAANLAAHGHELVELERGSLDTKLWKEVKRKRVRIPDLVCRICGLRVESRAKTKTELAMSHSEGDEARAWDFGMVDSDWIAFPICEAIDEKYWSAGKLRDNSSYWHERNWIRWESRSHINYFTTREFRSTPASGTGRKGVTEGSETTLSWDAAFASGVAVVDTIEGQRLTVRRESDGRRQTRNLRAGLNVFVAQGDRVELNQVLAAVVRPLTVAELACPGRMPEDHIAHLLSSRERTQRFTGVKLARLRNDRAYREAVNDLANDDEEDIYIRLEAISYLASVCQASARELFAPYLTNPDNQTQLETVIALGEAATDEAVEVLSEILGDSDKPYFIRSAAAWCLSRVGRDEAAARLIEAFADVDVKIREEALEGIVAIGGPAIPILLAGLEETDNEIVAGCAEALRQQQPLEGEALSRVVKRLKQEKPSEWVVWLLGHLPREQVAASIADMQQSAPELHYAISVLWSFVDSWIARRWELNPGTVFPSEEAENV
jgi:HEAT repeat protein